MSVQPAWAAETNAVPVLKHALGVGRDRHVHRRRHPLKAAPDLVAVLANIREKKDDRRRKPLHVTVQAGIYK
jgi:hypothetical protein